MRKAELLIYALNVLAVFLVDVRVWLISKVGCVLSTNVL